jgi:Glycosyltransferase family 87
VNQTTHSCYWYFRLFLVLHVIILGVFNLSLGCYATLECLHSPDPNDLSRTPFGGDFLCYWTASRVARTQGPAAVFSLDTMAAAEREVIGADTWPRYWKYPPTYLLMVLPLSLLPYAASFICWIVLTGLGFVYVIRRLIPKNPLSWLVLVFPGTVHNLFAGQNGFLSAAILGGGLLLADRRPFAGGCLLGLLSYKPQLAFLIPLALAAGRYWKALIGAVISAITLALASLLLLGSSVWIAFFKNLPLAAGFMNRASVWTKVPTVFAVARLQGATLELATGLQAVAIIAAILAVGWVWFRRAPLPIRGSVLVVGICLATPHAFNYDLTISALPFAWLGWEAYTQGSKFQEVFLLLALILLAWALLEPPWMYSWALEFPFRLVVEVSLLLLVLYRAVRPLSGSSAKA